MTDVARLAGAGMPAGRSAAREWREGWPLVFVGLLGSSLLSLAVLTLGAFIAPLEQAFGWSRAQISAGITVYSVVGLLSSPFVGALLDRFGARRVALPGLILTAVAYALLATSNGSVAYWLALWFLLSAANQLITTTVWSAAVSGAFATSRGLALGITFTGNGLCALAGPLAINLLIEHQSWRIAYLAIGLGWGGFVTLAALFLFFERRDRAARPAAGAPAHARPSGRSAREGLRSRTFATIAVATVLSLIVALGVVVHLIPLLSDRGLSRDSAVEVASVLGLAMIAGKLLVGALADRMPAKFIAAGALLAQTGACALLLQPQASIAARTAAVALFGTAVGGLTPITVYLISRYFGMRAFGTIFGVLVSCMAIANGSGPVVAGMIYDHLHSYTPLLVAGIPITLLSAGLLLSLGRYPEFVEEG